MNPDHLPDLQQALLDWFAEHQRPLPWRRQYTPLRNLGFGDHAPTNSGQAMLPFYTRWMSELPTVHSVAAASEEMVLKLWEGLGYYSRARNLQKAARVICDEHGGELQRISITSAPCPASAPTPLEHLRASRSTSLVRWWTATSSGCSAGLRASASRLNPPRCKSNSGRSPPSGFRTDTPANSIKD